MSGKWRALAVLLISVFAITPLFADKLDEETLKKKKRGWYFTGLPLISYNTDNGLGYGARVYFYHNGKDEDPGFDETPYFTQLYGQFYQTTGGWQYHTLNLDQYRPFGVDIRLQVVFVYDRKTHANYYGIGGRTTSKNLEDSNFVSHKTFQHYQDRFLKAYDSIFFEPNNIYHWYTKVNYKYNVYGFEKPGGYVNVIGKIVIPELQYVVGFQGQWVGITKWDLHGYRVNKKRYVAMQPTKLMWERPRGYQGGWCNYLRLGLAYKSLDYEPDPRKGYMADYSFETSQRFFGSDYIYYRNTLGFRGYYTLWDHLTFAGRLAYTNMAYHIPFFEMNTFAFPWNRQTGLGGNRTLRGYKDSRFVGPTMTMANIELRYHIGDIMIPVLGRFGLKIVAFFDAGNAYDKPGDPFEHPRWKDYKYSYGGGIVIPWNLATIIHVYYARSSEDSAISVDFNHAIQ